MRCSRRPRAIGEDVPIDPDFHARRLPDRAWRHVGMLDGIEAVIQLHRLREVLALVGFTRFEAVMPDINGEYETDVERAALAIEPKWFPAVENRARASSSSSVPTRSSTWLERPGVKERVDALAQGHEAGSSRERKTKRPFPGGPYVLLHTLSHLLIESLAMRCGYPASSIRERIYVDGAGGRYGILLYTGSSDAEGTLGGLVQQARHLEAHLAQALRWRRSARTTRSAPSTRRARASSNAGSTAPRATAARWSPRRRARCATTTSTARWWCRCSAWQTRRSSRPSHD